MTFFALGLNHETASLATREAFALGPERTRELLQSLSLSDGAELVLLSTCNRTEAYFYGDAEDAAHVIEGIAGAAGRAWPHEVAFCIEDEAAVRHVLSVASGLKSMVIGDVQILAQMKEAYRLAVEVDRVGTVVHRLMHTAFRTAKRIRTSTNIGSGAVSVSSAAVALSRAHFGGTLTGRSVLLVGAGEVSRLVLHALEGEDHAGIRLVNRSQDRAEKLASDFGASADRWDRRHALACEADLVIVATAAESPILYADQFPFRSREEHQTLVIDLAVPRNVDPLLDDVEDFRVLDMDALEVWTRDAEAARRLELPKADDIAEEELAEFVTWMFHHQALQPAIDAVRETFERIRRQEIDRHHDKFVGADRESLDLLTRSIMQKLLSVPIVRLKAYDPGSVDLVEGVSLLRSFFGRPDCEDESAVEADGSDASALTTGAGRDRVEEPSPGSA